tara:strand:+ start:220 stop:441 length:222 start_codon:yes stop_codon:yes gene_type:complete
MELIANGKHFRVFHNRFLGLWSYFILEDSSNSTKSQGVDYNVKITYYYFKTKAQMKLLVNDMFEDGLAPGVWN